MILLYLLRRYIKVSLLVHVIACYFSWWAAELFALVDKAVNRNRDYVCQHLKHKPLAKVNRTRLEYLSTPYHN
jgi:hypothetical protein